MQSALNLVRELDMFAMPVSLTYKGKRQFSTLLGGFCSLFLILVFMAYSAVTMHKLIVDPVFQMNNSMRQFLDSANNTEFYNITTKESSLAVWITGSHTYHN